MYEEILLMKKIVDYFNKLKKTEIANIINEELQREVQKAPNFQEPDYAKEDLTTIFFRHVTLKRRKSEALMKKSNTNNTINKSTNSRKSKQPAQTSLFTVVNDENQEDVQIDNNSSSDILKETNHSILAPINTNRISENIVRKSQFLPEIGSTPNHSNSNLRIEKREATLEQEINLNDENSDSDSLIISDHPSENCHQKINLDPEEFDNCYDISNFTNDYETFMRQSQLDNYTSEGGNVESNCEEISKVKENLSSFEGIYQCEQIAATRESLEESDNGIMQAGGETSQNYDDSIYPSSLIQNSASFQCGQVPDETQENNISRNSSSQEQPNVNPQVMKVTNEIAIQCDPCELLTEDDAEYVEPAMINRKRLQDEEINRNTKKCKIAENDIIDLDDEVKEKENVGQQNIEIIDLHFAAEELIVDNKRPRRTSLSSIDTLPDEVNESKTVKSRKKVANKSTIIYKEDRKLDMKRRILLTDGWILWPSSLLSGCLKHYNEDGFIEVLGLEIDDVSNLTKKTLLCRFLENMYVENLISKIHHPSKKVDLYLKLASLSEDLFECLDIPMQTYTDNLWNKSLGPKNGRKLCAEGAPEVVKDLLHLELDFVNNLL